MPSATTPPTATYAASPPGWLGATRSAPTRPRPPAWSAPPTRRWFCWGAATWQTPPVRPTQPLEGSPLASAAEKPGATEAPLRPYITSRQENTHVQYHLQPHTDHARRHPGNLAAGLHTRGGHAA